MRVGLRYALIAVRANYADGSKRRFVSVRLALVSLFGFVRSICLRVERHTNFRHEPKCAETHAKIIGETGMQSLENCRLEENGGVCGIVEKIKKGKIECDLVASE